MKVDMAADKAPKGIVDKTTTYKADLVARYWKYQQNHFPDLHNHFELGHVPPVFLTRAAWGNILFDPNADDHEREALLKLIPVGEHHKWFRSMNSSQALAQSVLGNLAIHDSLGCLNDLPADDGGTLFSGGSITSKQFAMEHKIGYLGEPHPTSLDGYFSGDYRIAIECKFTEQEVGTCSKPHLAPELPFHCDGTYTHKGPGEGPCPMTPRGVKYWKYVRDLFTWESDVDADPCPLYKNYQLVRNILAAGVREDGSVSAENGHVVLIYDGRNPAFLSGGAGLRAYSDTRNALRRPEMLRKCSWQAITQRLRSGNILPWLTEQLAEKYGL
jgi:hypothetical protein